MTSRYLLISRIGPESRHDRWLGTSTTRHFDVLLSCYDPGLRPVAGDGITWEYRPGAKVAGYHALLCERAEEIAAYDYVALLDDDLEADTAVLNRMFTLGALHDLKIFMPALTADSYYTYAGTIRQPGLTLRWTTFVEMGAPVFRGDILPAIRELYGLGHESGIDIAWSALLAETDRDLAILDATPVRHPRPVGGKKAANGFVDGATYEDHIHSVLAHFGIPWLRCVPRAALTKGGRTVSSKTALTLYATSTLRAVPLRWPIGGRLRNVLVHLRHLVSGPTPSSKTLLFGDDRRGSPLAAGAGGRCSTAHPAGACQEGR